MRRLTVPLAAAVTWLATCACAQAAWPNDPEFAAWHPWTAKINWTPPVDDPGTPAIAIVDTGLSSRLDDFQGYVDPASADCSGGGKARIMHAATDVDDHDGHGTQVATLAAAPANGLGSVGASPQSPLIVIRIHPGQPGDLACAFKYLRQVAVNVPLVVNVSQELHSTPPAAARELAALVKAGALVVAAAGNDDRKPALWPAKAEHVLAVGRDDGAGATGSLVDVTAPGANLRLPDANGTWTTGGAAGTSFAAPLVAGAAARLWAELGDVDPQVVSYLLRRTAHRNLGRGFGEIDLGAALRQKPPIVAETEPNDDAGHAVRKACAHRCTLQGIVASSDDRDDFWLLKGRHTCRGLTRLKTTGATVTCTARHRVVRLLVRAKPHANVAYTVRIRR